MSYGLYLSANGALSSMHRQNVYANNLANLNTAGFKRSILQVAELPSKTFSSPGMTQGADGSAVPVGLQIGTGVEALGTIRIYTPGVLEGSNRNLDIAIEGQGFFQVQLPDGTTGYTRDGVFQINAVGKLVTSAGHVLQPEVTLNADVLEVGIDPEGRVTVRTQGSNTVALISQIQLAKFINPSGLLAMGSNILKETDASGQPIVSNAGSNGLGTLKQGFIERSNVEIVNELVALIVAQRAYEVNSKAIQTSDQMLSVATNIVR